MEYPLPIPDEIWSVLDEEGVGGLMSMYIESYE